jgi:arylsulfatase A-like enzyme
MSSTPLGPISICGGRDRGTHDVIWTWGVYQSPEESIEACRGRYDVGYEVIRNNRYERQVKTGLFDPKIAPLSPPEYDQPWEALSDELKCRRIAQMEVYAAMVERMDENIGRVIDLLDQQGRLENTIVFFLNDNGACPTDPAHRVGNYRKDVPIGGVDSYEAGTAPRLNGTLR